MTEYEKQLNDLQSWVKDRVFLGRTMTETIKELLTPFNIIASIIISVGLVLVVTRFTQGLGTVTAASQDQPWGLFLGWGLFSGVPLSATGFILGAAVFLFGLKEYKPVLNNALLLGFLGYLFAVVSLLIDLGRPWRIYFPMFVSFGTASVLFLVGWHVALYTTCQFLEVFPNIAAWGGWKKLRKSALSITIALTVFGIILSTLHQSALGAMFLLAPGKLHPLWYSPYLPVLFLISAVAAGLCMVIFVTFLTTRFFRKQADAAYLASVDNITLGLGTAAAFVLITYFALKMIALTHGNHWDLLNTPFGYWFLVEIFVFVLAPCFLLLIGSQMKKVGLVQFSALYAIIGVIINRLNVSLIALNWNLPNRELFNLREFLVVLAIVTTEILVYRWIVTRMPILRAEEE